jgi:hypothetical protein
MSTKTNWPVAVSFVMASLASWLNSYHGGKKDGKLQIKIVVQYIHGDKEKKYVILIHLYMLTPCI